MVCHNCIVNFNQQHLHGLREWYQNRTYKQDQKSKTKLDFYSNMPNVRYQNLKVRTKVCLRTAWNGALKSGSLGPCG